MVVCASVYAVFIAVDGVALGIMVNRWAEAGPEQQELLYEIAFAVRQIEAGLFSMQWLMFAIAAGLFAGAFFASAQTPFRLDWLSGMGWLSVVASIGVLSFGIVQAQTGFSDLSMASQTEYTWAGCGSPSSGCSSTGTRYTSIPVRRSPTERTTSTVTTRPAEGGEFARH